MRHVEGNTSKYARRDIHGRDPELLKEVEELGKLKQSRLVLAEVKHRKDTSVKTEYVPVGVAMPLGNPNNKIVVMFAINSSCAKLEISPKTLSYTPQKNSGIEAEFKEMLGPDPRPYPIESPDMNGFENVDQAAKYFSLHPPASVEINDKGNNEALYLRNIFKSAKEKAMKEEKEWESWEKAYLNSPKG